MKKINGFTLVEMLVSMAILSMVLLIASNAYSLFSDRWNGRLGHFNRTVIEVKHLILVQESLKSLIAYVVTDEEKQSRFYFEGNRNGFVAVTLRSLFTPEVAAVVRLKLIQNDDFSFALIYEEAAMHQQQLLLKVTQELNFDNSIILFNNLTEADFQYFGWASLEDKNWTPDTQSLQPPVKVWLDEYNSLERNMLPEKIIVNFLSKNKEYSLQAKLNDSVPGVLVNYADKDQ